MSQLEAIKLLPYLLTVFAIVGPWFFQSGYILLTDLTWGPHVVVDFSSNFWLLQFVIKTLTLVLAADLVEKVYLAAVMLALLVAGRRLARQFINDEWLVFVLSLFMVFNPFVYERLLFGQVTIVAALAFMVWGFGFLVSYMMQPRQRYLYIAACWLGFSVMFAPHFIFLIGLLYLSFLAIYLFAKSQAEFWHVALRLIMSWLVIIVLNSNWLFGLLFGQTGVSQFVAHGITFQDFEVFQTAGRTGWQALLNVLLLSGFWGSGQMRFINPADLPGVGVRSFLLLVPVLLAGIIAALRKPGYRTLIVVFLVAAGIATALAVGVRLPLTRAATEWLFVHAPFYKGLRETQKWVALLVAMYYVCLTLGASVLSHYAWIKSNRALALLLLAGLIIAQAPLLLWGFRGQVQAVRYPVSWSVANNAVVTSTNCQDSVLVLPWHLYQSFRFSRRVIAHPARLVFACPTISGTNMEFGGIYDNSGDPQGALVEQWLDHHDSVSTLLQSQLDVGYIVLLKEVDWEAYSWLNELPGLQLVSDNPDLRLFKVAK